MKEEFHRVAVALRQAGLIVIFDDGERDSPIICEMSIRGGTANLPTRDGQGTLENPFFITALDGVLNHHYKEHWKLEFPLRRDIKLEPFEHWESLTEYLITKLVVEL